MLKRTTLAAMAILIALAAPAAAQTCNVAIYGDLAGTQSFVSPVVGESFDVHVVMFVEGLANAVAYTLNITGGQDLFPGAVAYGIGGGGLNIPNDLGNELYGGSNVGLGQCAVGFNGVAIQVASYSFFAAGVNGAATFSLTGNDDASNFDGSLPVYSDCLGVISQCQIGADLTVEAPVSNDAASFGAVKGLFN